jgi:RNA 2',3'-cyclic 3'-phosphodiesterase
VSSTSRRFLAGLRAVSGYGEGATIRATGDVAASLQGGDASQARLFFALVPPPSLQQTLGALARHVAERCGGRAVAPQNIHLTLAFIGAWPVARIVELTQAAARVPVPAMTLSLDTLGAFRRAGVAWIGTAAPPAALMTLASSLSTALAAAGVPLEARRFHPHLTLARKCRSAHAIETAGPHVWDVDAMTLVASRTRAEGARYTAVAEWRLSGPGAR